MSNMTGATSGEGTAYHSGTHRFNAIFSGILVAQSFFCIVFCGLLFVVFFNRKQ
jgi:hypothetical protein